LRRTEAAGHNHPIPDEACRASDQPQDFKAIGSGRMPAQCPSVIAPYEVCSHSDASITDRGESSRAR